MLKGVFIYCGKGYIKHLKSHIQEISKEVEDQYLLSIFDFRQNFKLGVCSLGQRVESESLLKGSGGERLWEVYNTVKIQEIWRSRVPLAGGSL